MPAAIEFTEPKKITVVETPDGVCARTLCPRGSLLDPPHDRILLRLH